MSKRTFDLHEIENPLCLMCSPDKRFELLENALCKAIVSSEDGKPVRCVGGWGREKIYFLTQYFRIFSVGMKNRWELGYFEIGSGPGRCVDRENRLEFDGSSLAIAKLPEIRNLKAARFIDLQPGVVSALNERLEAQGLVGDYRAEEGSYEDGEKIANTMLALNPNGLNLVFIDPTDCSVPFSTLQIMKKRGLKFDLIINVATKSDFGRNMGIAIKNVEYEVRKKYERFLGGSRLFENSEFILDVNNSRFDAARQLFVAEYMEMLKGLGYAYFDRKEIHGLYELLFASCHAKGLDFWSKAGNIEMNGQRGLGF
jgi:three-Cys-motif partner protein